MFLSFRQPPPWLTPRYAPPFAVNRSCCGVRLALADGSSLPFSLHPPLAAFESQTRQRKVIRRFAVRSQLSLCELCKRVAERNSA